VERITLIVHSASVPIVEAGTLEDSGGVDVGLVRPDMLSCRCRLCLCLGSSPFGRQDSFALGEIVETGIVIMEPEEELQVLCGVLNVLEVVHEVANGAWLVVGVSIDQMDGLFTRMTMHRRTYRASAIVDNVVKGQGIRDSCAAARAGRVVGLGFLFAIERGGGFIDVRRATIGE
jgi:hypothetical protein